MAAAACLALALTAPDAMAVERGCATEIHAAEQRHGIPEGLLMAIGMVESSLNPLALNVGGRTRLPSNRTEAARLLVDGTGAPRRDVTIGCMQIHSRYHLDAVGGQPQRFLDPAVNVDYAAAMLRALYERNGSWRTAVGRYNTAPSSPNFERYICRVDRQLRQIGGEVSLGCRI